MSIVQPPSEDKGRPSNRPTSGGSGGGRPKPGPGRPPAKGNQSQKGAGNRPVNPLSAGQKGTGNRKVDPRSAQQRAGGSGRPPANARQGGQSRGQQATVSSRRPSPTILGLGAVVIVLIVVIVLVVVGVGKSAGKQQGADKGNGALPSAPASLVATVTSVPQSVFQKVGLPSEITNYPKKVTGHKALTQNGLPEMLYEGAEYCPFCGAERWAMIMALSKFGTFSGLKLTYSSVSDFAPDTATFSFYGSHYTSKYVAFQPYELATNQQAASSTACNVNGYACLETPPSAAYNLLESLGGGSFPFMDFGNKLMQAGAGFEDQPLALAGMTQAQVAAQLSDASGQVAQAEVGSANYITGAICSMTGDQPSSVCSASYVKSAQKAGGVSS